MTVLSRGARVRRGGRRPGWVLLTALLVLAIGASSALVFTNRVELLKLAVILALWAAVAGAFVSVLYRRQSDADQSRARDLKLVYDLQLDREISARREYELTVESQLRRELASEMRAAGRRRSGRAARRTGRAADQPGDPVRHRSCSTAGAGDVETRTAARAYSDWERNGEGAPVDWVSSDRVTPVRQDDAAAACSRRRCRDHRRARGAAVAAPGSPPPCGRAHRRPSEPPPTPERAPTGPREPAYSEPRRARPSRAAPEPAGLQPQQPPPQPPPTAAASSREPDRRTPPRRDRLPAGCAGRWPPMGSPPTARRDHRPPATGSAPTRRTASRRPPSGRRRRATAVPRPDEAPRLAREPSARDGDITASRRSPGALAPLGRVPRPSARQPYGARTRPPAAPQPPPPPPRRRRRRAPPPPRCPRRHAPRARPGTAAAKRHRGPIRHRGRARQAVVSR